MSYAGYEKVSAGLRPSRLKARSLFALDRHFLIASVHRGQWDPPTPSYCLSEASGQVPTRFGGELGIWGQVSQGLDLVRGRGNAWRRLPPEAGGIVLNLGQDGLGRIYGMERDSK